MICNLCPRNCDATRSEYSGNGFCRMGTLPVVARVAPHMWEEPCISGTNGSGTIFFSGCTLRCVFCQNHTISAKNYGKVITAETLAEEFRKLEDKQVHNINLVSPTPFSETIIEAFEIYKPQIPVVFNCGGYEKVNTIKKFEGIVDIYLPDFKYSNNDLGKNYSACPDYVENATAAIKEMLRQTGGPVIDDNGIMQKGTIIRHLVLPNHTKNSIGVLNILDKIRNEYPHFLVSLMAQYLPLGNADKYEKLNRKITQREYEKVKSYLLDLGFDGFVQERDSADKAYVPDWDY